VDQIDALTGQVDALSDRASELIAQIPAAWDVDAGGTSGPDAGNGPDAAVLPAVARLDEITGCGIIAAQGIVAESGSTGALPRRGPFKPCVPALWAMPPAFPSPGDWGGWSGLSRWSLQSGQRPSCLVSRRRL
jgi:hypothetical protein